MNTKEYYAELVKHPGKFEGEQPWAPYFWEQVMDGQGETVYADFEDDNEDSEAEILYNRFYIDGNDIEVFPELEEHQGDEIRIWEDSQGFVYCTIHSTKEVA